MVAVDVNDESYCEMLGVAESEYPALLTAETEEELLAKSREVYDALPEFVIAADGAKVALKVPNKTLIKQRRSRKLARVVEKFSVNKDISPDEGRFIHLPHSGEQLKPTGIQCVRLGFHVSYPHWKKQI